MSLRADSSGLIILVFSTARSRSLRAEACVRQTALRGWRSTASRCKSSPRSPSDPLNHSRVPCRLNIALELAKHNPVYEDIASKFFEHFIFISDAMTYKCDGSEESLWNEQDGMYYDAIEFGPGNTMQLPVRSLVGLIPLYATLVLEPAVVNKLPSFKKRMEWFIENRPEWSERNIANMKGEWG